MKFDIQVYWDMRYKKGGTSGAGSYGRLREFKLGVINGLIREHSIGTLLDLGCGDGSVASGIKVPYYTGVDIAQSAVDLCREKGLTAYTLDDPAWNAGRYDMTLSCDVVFHLVDDAVFAQHMHDMFRMAGRLAVIYSSDRDEQGGHPEHFRNRRFSDFAALWYPGFSHTVIRNPFPLKNDPENESVSDFHVFRRAG